ncbi:MAG TPA: chorismate synthase [Elusimicrobiales bacterium]|nr:chorismate synthase [Elusimicrobiales bacterium]
MLRYLTAGESHGETITGILDGFPAGVPVTAAHIAAQLRRRRLAPGRGPRQAYETDAVSITAGVYNGLTTGAPIAVSLKNSKPLGKLPFSSTPRPGHADLAGMLKYGILNAALIRERASARETAARVALGTFALRLHELLGIRFRSRVVSLGADHAPTPKKISAALAAARRAGDTLGGVFELDVCGLPAGLGGYSQGDLRLGSRLAAALLAINSVKGFAVGGGFGLADLGGAQAAKEPLLSGGLDGGMTNGGVLTLRCAVKPVPGLAAGAQSVDLKTFKKTAVKSLTSDTTAVFAAAVIAEHAAALELAAAVLEKFGGDSLAEIQPRLSEWRRKTGQVLDRL